MSAPSRHKLAVHVVPLQKNTETKKPTVDEATVEKATVEKATMEKATVEKATMEKATIEKAMMEEATVDKATVEEATVDKATVALGESADRGEASREEAIVKKQETTEGEGKPVEIEEADSIIESLVVKVSMNGIASPAALSCIMNSCLLPCRNVQVLVA